MLNEGNWTCMAAKGRYNKRYRWFDRSDELLDASVIQMNERW